MASVDVFRGLFETNFDSLAPAALDNPFVAAFPTFRTFTPAGGTQRDELILLRASRARTTAMHLVANDTASSALAFWGEEDVPRVFSTLNDPAFARRRGFPTFNYGHNSSGRFMNVVLMNPGFTTIIVSPGTPGIADPTNVEAMCAAAQTWAEANGNLAAIPMFTRAPLPSAPINPPPNQIGHSLLVFPSTLTGVIMNSHLAPGQSLAPRWTVKDLPILLDDMVYADPPDGLQSIYIVEVGPLENGVAILNDSGSPELFLRSNGNTVQFRPDAATDTSVLVDPDASGARHQYASGLSSVSAVSSGGTTHVLRGTETLFHASRPDASPTAFTYLLASGSTLGGCVGAYNRAFIAPGGTLNALAYLWYPPELGVSPGPGETDSSGAPGFDDTKRRNLRNLTFDGTTWTALTVDGDSTTNGHIVGDCGSQATAAFEPDGTMHAFYLFRSQSPTEMYQLETRGAHRHGLGGRGSRSCGQIWPDGGSALGPRSRSHDRARGILAGRRLLRRRALGRVRGQKLRQPALRTWSEEFGGYASLDLPRRRRQSRHGSDIRRRAERRRPTVGRFALPHLRGRHEERHPAREATAGCDTLDL